MEKKDGQKNRRGMEKYCAHIVQFLQNVRKNILLTQ
jgi:hypothetical protein